MKLNLKKRKKLIIKIIIILSIYLFLVFLVPLLFFPGFLSDIEIQKTENLMNLAEEFKADNKEETMKNVFNYVDEKYEKSSGYKIFILLNRHFYTDVEKYIDTEGYMPCHIQTLILKTLLINTGQFQEEDFEKKIIIMPEGLIHRYCLVKIDDKTFKVDPYYGILKEVE